MTVSNSRPASEARLMLAREEMRKAETKRYVMPLLELVPHEVGAQGKTLPHEKTCSRRKRTTVAGRLRLYCDA